MSGTSMATNFLLINLTHKVQDGPVSKQQSLQLKPVSLIEDTCALNPGAAKKGLITSVCILDPRQVT